MNTRSCLPGTERRAWPSFAASMIVVVVVLLGSGTSLADQIQLKDGTEFAGTILKKDHEQVIVGLSRSSVATINGQPLLPPVARGTRAPAFIATDVAGVTQSLANAKGRPTLLQFWATWCPHCRRDLPMMNELFAKYPSQQLHLLTVSVDQDLNALTAFLKNQQAPFPVIPAYGQPEASEFTVADLYEIEGIPAYYLIDANGIIVKTWAGSISASGSRQELEETLAGLLPSSSARRTSSGTSASETKRKRRQ